MAALAVLRKNLGVLGAELRHVLADVPPHLWQVPSLGKQPVIARLLNDESLDDLSDTTIGFDALKNLRECVFLLKRASFEKNAVATTDGVKVTANGYASQVRCSHIGVWDHFS